MTRVAGDLASATRRAALIRWPDDGDLRDASAQDGIACLLLVERGDPIPAVGDGEDWLYADSDERDVAARLADLERYGRSSSAAVMPVVPSGLNPVEHGVAVTLAQSAGVFVPRSDLVADDLDAAIASLRPLLAAEGWQILEVGAAGFVLERDGEAAR